MISQGVKLEVVKKTSKYQKSTFAINIISGRENLGMTAEQFAEFAGIPYPTLRGIEHGSSNGSVKTKNIIARALKTTVDELNTPVNFKPKQSLKSELIVSVMAALPSLNEDDLSIVLNTINNLKSASTVTTPRKAIAE